MDRDGWDLREENKNSSWLLEGRCRVTFVTLCALFA